MKYLNNLNLNQNELQNAIIQKLSTAPSTPVEGQVYYNTANHAFYVYNGTDWITYADASGAMVVHDNDYHSVDFEDSANKENTTIDTSTTKYPTVNLLKTGLDGKSDTGHDHLGVYEPADATILKDADIGVNVQAYDANIVSDGAYVHTDNNYTITEKNKLAAIAEGAEVNQSAFSYFAVAGQTTVGADEDSDTINFVNGNNITITTDNVSKNIIIDAVDTTYSAGNGITESGEVFTLGTPSTLTGATINEVTATSHTHELTLTNSDVGLENVENKSSATIRSEITSTNVTDGLGFTPEDSANKGEVNGYAGLDANAKVPLSQLPDIAKSATTVLLSTDSKPTTPLEGDRVFETDTGDSYIYDGSSWVIMADADWENVSLDWSNITGGPSSTPAQIDSAVTDSHTHSNKATLDLITAAGSGSIITTVERNKLSGIDENANNYIHPTDGAGSLSSLTGATVLSGVTINSEGHVTGTTTRDITAVDVGATRKYSEAIGDGVETSFTVTHNLGSRDVMVQIIEASSPYEVVYADVEVTTTNVINVFFASPPSSGEYRITVIG